MDLLDVMLDHDRWATATLLDASRGLTDAQLDQEFDIGHRTLRATFGHMIFNVPFWTAFLEGHDPDGFSADEQPEDRSVAALTEHHERLLAALATVARRIRDEERFAQTYIDHYLVKKSFGGTILTVIEHNVEHRSEVSHILARLGVSPVPEVDLGVWDYELHNK